MTYINACMWNLEKWYRWMYLQARSRDADALNRRVNTGGRGGWHTLGEWSWYVFTITRDGAGLWGSALEPRQLSLAPWWPRRVLWGVGRSFKSEGIFVNIQPIHFIVQQKITQPYKQLYSNKKSKKKNNNFKVILQKHWIIVWWLVCKNCFTLGTHLSGQILNIPPKYFPG